MEEHKFDVIIIGTNLANSILAAACSWEGQKVLHIDKNPFYGELDGSLALHDLLKLSDSCSSSNKFPFANFDSEYSKLRSIHVQVYNSEELLAAKSISIQLIPRALFASGDLIKLLTRSHIYKYLELKPVYASELYSYKKDWLSVPESRSDIFTNKILDLKSKRKVMRFVTFVLSSDQEPHAEILEQYYEQPFKNLLSNHFGLSHELRECVIYGLCRSLRGDILTKDAITIIRKHIQSHGIYGNFSMLKAKYGTGSELCQAFCRSAAVMGATYMLSQEVRGIGQNTVTLENGEVFHAKVIIDNKIEKGPSLFRIHQRCIVYKGDCRKLFKQRDVFLNMESSHYSFSPASLDVTNDASVQCLIIGPQMGECPRDHTIWYLRTLESSNCDAALLQAENLLLQRCDPEHPTRLMQMDIECDDTTLMDYDAAVLHAQSQFLDLFGSLDHFLVPEKEDEEE
ncbi:rab geranylgeranyltransferase escort protein [Schizosaccharomyces japonicus yFS275]|uniref:Rab geranylgeranyltransferase escort protein n=1 Tax=Schizosaccharomyces japonicus (strain yFS275 / FY16936) TaxID=402676 RepID=B6JZM0_SCHJY|nr:rab geranylgeranyltransferase escort protein [Schizosaccharomyces japonicus yFS275]EEB06988.1 rab geranylgeranyltransferase escort protein [Schizosaccharomyces japonicus yFS275]